MKKLYTFKLALFLVLAALAQQAFSQNSSVLITEISGFDSPNPNANIVEITNRGSNPVDISDWKLLIYEETNMTHTSGKTMTVPGDIVPTTLQAGASFVFYYNSGSNPLVPSGISECGYMSKSSAGSKGRDTYELRDASDNVVDIYGVIGENPEAGIDWNYRNSIVTRNGGIDQAYGNDNFDLDDWYILRNALVEEITPC